MSAGSGRAAFVARLTAGMQSRAGEPRGTHSLDSMLWRTFSAAGRNVTADNVTGIAAVWAAAWLVADQGGSLPLRVYTNREDKLIPNPGAWQNKLLRQPNPEATSTGFYGTLLAHLELWANAYVGKEKLLGRVVRLWIIPPSRVTVRRINGVKYFDVLEDDGSYRTYTSDDVIHIVGRSLDGVIGASPLSIHRNTYGFALALDDFGGETFRNRAIPPGILSVKGRITDPKVKEELREDWNDRYGSRRGRAARDKGIAVLDEDARFQALSMPLADAQYVELCNFSVQDIARVHGVFPEMIGGAAPNGSMTYQNLQQRNSALLQLVLWPRLKRIEGAFYADVDLFPAGSRSEPHFDDTDYVRGDPRGQFETLKIATGNKPILTQDEARAFIGREPLGDTAAELDSKSTPEPGQQQSQEVKP